MDASGNQVDSLTTAHGTVSINTATGDYTFTPTGDSSLGVGQTLGDSFKVVAVDNHGAASAPSTVAVTITGSNDGPTVSVANVTTANDHTAITGHASGADVDTGDTVRYHLMDASGNQVDSLTTAHGTVSINTATGDYTFTPTGDSSLGVGQTLGDSFKVVAVDNHGAASAPSTVAVTITGSNDGPVVDLVSGGHGTEDNAIRGAVSAHDVDTGDRLSYSLVDSHGNAVASLATDHGTVSINQATGEYTFTPNANWAGNDSFNVQVSDGHGGTLTQAVNVHADAVADAPTLSLQLGGGSAVTLPGVSEHVTIDTSNMHATNSGFTVSALNLDGSAGNLSTHSGPAGFGVTGNASGDQTELGQSGGHSEKIVVNFDNDVSSANVSFAWLNNQEHAHYDLYQNGVKVGEGTVTGITDNVDPAISLTAANGGSFDQIVFSAPSGGDNDYLIHSISYDVAEPGERVVNYPLNVSSGLTDTDGSERLAVTLNGLPEGAVVMDANGTVVGTNTGNGTWSLPGGHIDGLTLQVPADSHAFTLGAVATSTESDPNAALATASTSVSVAVAAFDHAPVAGDDSHIDNMAQGPALSVAMGTTVDDVHTTTTTTTVVTGNQVSWGGLDSMSDPTTATPTTTVSNDLNTANNGTANADVISVGHDNNASISTGAGDDQVTIGHSVNSKIDLGAGTNALDVGADVNASVVGGAGNDTVRVGGALNSNIDLGNGDNRLQVGGDASASISTGSGSDDVKIVGSLNSNVSLGSGDDDLQIGGSANASIDAGEGNDRVLVGRDLSSTANLGSGDDYLEVKGNDWASINAGAGNDTVKIGGAISANVDMGSGDDHLTITGQNLWATVSGGSGTDSIELTGVTKAQWDANVNGIKGYVKDFENIKFSDGQVIGDATAFQATTTVTTTTTTHSYETPITVQATLNDRDGSETLSPVTIANIPAGGHLELNGQALTPNSDGSYTLNVSSGSPVTVTLVTDAPVSANSLNLTTTVHSTEAHGGDVSVTTLVGVGSNAGETVVDDRIATGTDHKVVINASDLLANDTDADGDALSITAVGGAHHGTVSMDNAGHVTFTAEAGFNGTATFDYTVSDGHGGTDTATVSVNVVDPNHAPVIDAAHTTATLNIDDAHANTTNIGQVTATDVDGDTLSYSVLAGGTHHGSLVLDANSGSFFYNADDTSWSGTDTFTVQVNDGEGGTATQSVSVHVTGGSQGGKSGGGTGSGHAVGWGDGGGRDESWGANGSWSIDAISGGGSNGGHVVHASDNGTDWSSSWSALDVGNGGHAGTGDRFSIAGDNRHDEFYNGHSGDTLIGAAGNDYMSLEGADGKQHISGYDHIQMGDGDNAILDMTTSHYDYGNLTVAGGTGHDVIWSASGDDLLVAGNGGDTIHGGAGNDTIVAGAGSDNLMGQDGSDTFMFDFGAGHDIVNGGAGATWTDTIDLSTDMHDGASITITTADNHSWTVASDGDHHAAGAIELGQDKAGTITVHSNHGDTQIEFTNIETIKY
ncbi:putative calcium binding hemolysin protein [Paramagnetospirillum magnetotacticum MS-1]|uniref:Putative calcium binding hemolysin protein n=2 Tax=Paramagnetospirillum magnetotacticum TaxID=188 RepID=A0A0C2UAI7_PARME|nr:putative calcium binding hemolysin protein [Paramagnetospirillum magnetotacticum MS-1]